ncbi:fungal transcriptional regulatory protein [Aureobasidium pullulans]|uniref:Fungal transcriptional regulatory protein n=1 Tax=Aureobasidium pullulans TaxID=5580 RepID=A0A4T0BLT4_AURPU|nr:fungal transcriptional regulatory protein [Aureobasidium pullulans]
MGESEAKERPNHRASSYNTLTPTSNECKRRKIKCNGQTPCQRCGNLALDCVYAPNCCTSNFKDTDEYRNMSNQIASLQDQVNALFASMNTLRADLNTQQPPIDPFLQHQSILQHDQVPSPEATRRKSMSRRPTFRGPTSLEFNLGVAKNHLENMGIAPAAPDDDGLREESPNGDVLATAPLHASKDPIWHVNREEALRLIRVYQDDMHIMYPLVSIPELTAYVNKLYTFMESAQRTGLMMRAFPGADSIDDEETNILKIVMATAMVVEGSGRSDLGRSMYAYVQPSIDALFLGDTGLRSVQLLALAATYQFHCDNEGISWRIIGLTARLCIELGLHRRETYDRMDEEPRTMAMLTFWSVYCLDRRWSFGTGMPFALQDSDIDPNLPKPGDKSLYLTAMIDHFAIASKVRHLIYSDSSRKQVSKEDVSYLDFQIVNWHRSLPRQLHWDRESWGQSDTDVSPGQQRLRIILYLRANVMRVMIHRPVLHSAASIMSNPIQAQTVVDIAKDTIRILTHINRTSRMYRASQSLFNAFLTTALAVLFLAVSHMPDTYAAEVREEFYMALDLVRGISKGSWISKRLWKTIRLLKEVGPKLGLMTSNGQNDPNHSAAVAMAGLAGHKVDEGAFLNTGSWNNMGSASSNSPDGMVQDLTNLFEAAGGYANGFGGGFGAGVHQLDESGFGGEDELSRILRDLF